MSLDSYLVDRQKIFNIQDKYFIFKLLSIEGVGRKTVKKIIKTLIKHEIDIRDFWVNKSSIWQNCRLGKKTLEKIINSNKEDKTYSIFDSLENRDIRVIAFWEKEYPKLLKQCDDFPLLLFAKGNLDCLNNDSIAVVGTRKITSYGKQATKKIVSDLVLEDFTIVSGFMYGVDINAHLEALEAGGSTIAVLGFGFNHMYPSGHAQYIDKIIDYGGCFITEYLPGVGPKKGNFPDRNRVVAGLSLGVVVIEAARKSGSHITVECAINEGREVFAVPGPYNNPFSEGTKWLINQGAKLITSGFDVADEFRSSLLNGSYNQIQEKILEILKSGSRSIDSVVEMLEFEPRLVMKEIAMLEIAADVVISENMVQINPKV